MMRKDSLERADAQAVPFEDLPVVHVWDAERQVGNLYSKTLGLQSTAWDFYLLYPPGVTWDEDEPPEPAFWMHQLPASSGAPRDLVLYPSKFSQELLRLLGDGVEPSRVSRDDLGLEAHMAGLVNMTMKKAEYTLDHVRQAFEESKTVRGI
jgi:hypothetical protein